MKSMDRDTIKQEIEGFLRENGHEKQELTVTVYLSREEKKQICGFHIDADYREILEDNGRSELIISDFTTPQSLIPEIVTIKYAEVTACEAETVLDGKKADLLKVVFVNGTVLELSFLYNYLSVGCSAVK